MIFLDASALLAAEDLDDSQHRFATALLESGVPLATLDLAAYETVNVAVSRWRDPAAADRLRRCETGQLRCPRPGRSWLGGAARTVAQYLISR